MKDIRRATRRHFSAQDKIRGIMDHANGKRRLAGDTARAALAQGQADRADAQIVPRQHLWPRF